MKIALATTTIHVPHALKLLRKCSPDVRFFVAGDIKSPHDEIFEMLQACHPASYIETATAPYKASTSETQSVYKCSELIGDNTLARRNIAFLEALKWGADVVVSWDTDNYPLDLSYFRNFEGIFSFGFDGISVTGLDNWYDAGAYLSPPAKHRGFPIQRKHKPLYKPVTDIKVGVAAGLILNDPDIDAVTRIANAPDPQQVSLLAEAGMVVDIHTWTTVNTQNTAVIRDLVPAWFLGPGLERMDDIYGGMIVQRVGRERGYHVHVGQPFALQQRHPHNLIKDLRAEIDGYERVVQLAELLDSIMLVGKNTIDDTRRIYETLEHCDWYPKQAVKAAFAWLEDCEGILA